MARSTIICSRIEANTAWVNWGCKGSRQGCWARPRTQQATRQNGRVGGGVRGARCAPAAAAAKSAAAKPAGQGREPVGRGIFNRDRIAIEQLSTAAPRVKPYIARNVAVRR